MSTQGDLAVGAQGPSIAVTTSQARDADLGDGTIVRRLLPTRARRTVGAWCFADDYGPTEIGTGPGMRVAPHPHIGLQTVTFLVAGEVLHRDGLGNAAFVRPGELALMTAGAGIVHSEESAPGHGPILQGVQLWVALPERDRFGAPSFEHLDALPDLALGPITGRVLVGALGSVTSPATVHSPLVAAELSLPGSPGSAATVPLDPGFEHALWVLAGEVRLDGTPVRPGTLAYVAPGADGIALGSAAPARALLLGGTPFTEELLMWWNFVARAPEEIEEARRRWEAGELAPVVGYDGERTPAPPLPAGRLRPRHSGRAT